MVKVLIMGLPGSGKTTLAKMIVSSLKEEHLPIIHFNADEIRNNVSTDLGFSLEDRIENSRRLSWLASHAKSSGIISITDFVCPLIETRKIFKPDILIFQNTISSGRFEDTNRMFQTLTSDELKSQPTVIIKQFLSKESETYLDLIRLIRSSV